MSECKKCKGLDVKVEALCGLFASLNVDLGFPLKIDPKPLEFKLPDVDTPDPCEYIDKYITSIQEAIGMITPLLDTIKSVNSFVKFIFKIPIIGAAISKLISVMLTMQQAFALIPKLEDFVIDAISKINTKCPEIAGKLTACLLDEKYEEEGKIL